jgi:hypothetical protein
MKVSVKLRSTKEDLNFSIALLNNELVILVDDKAFKEKTSSAVSSGQKPINLPITVKPKSVDSQVTGISPQIIDEIPAELVNFLCKDMFKVLSATTEKELQIYPDNVKNLILNDLKKLLQKEEEQWKIKYPDQKECPACIKGKVNRKILFQLLPFFYSDQTALLIQDLLDILINCVNLGALSFYKARNLLVQEADAILNSYLTEINNLQSGCSSCAKNAVRRKYNNIIVAKLQEILKHPSHV